MRSHSLRCRAGLFISALCVGSPCAAQGVIPSSPAAVVAYGDVAGSVSGPVDSVGTETEDARSAVSLDGVPHQVRIVAGLCRTCSSSDVRPARPARLSAGVFRSDTMHGPENRGKHALVGAAVGAFVGWVAGAAVDYEANKKTNHEPSSERIRVYLGQLVLPPIGAIIGGLIGWYS